MYIEEICLTTREKCVLEFNIRLRLRYNLITRDGEVKFLIEIEVYFVTCVCVCEQWPIFFSYNKLYSL